MNFFPPSACTRAARNWGQLLNQHTVIGIRSCSGLLLFTSFYGHAIEVLVSEMRSQAVLSHVSDSSNPSGNQIEKRAAKLNAQGYHVGQLPCSPALIVSDLGACNFGALTEEAGRERNVVRSYYANNKFLVPHGVHYVCGDSSAYRDSSTLRVSYFAKAIRIGLK